MSVLRSGGLTLLALAAVSGGAAYSQGPPAPGSAAGRQIRRPTTSPYLNLLRSPGDAGGLNLALDYYGIVRPQQQFRAAINRQSRSLGQLQRQVDEQGILIRSQNSQLGPTGHQVRFLDIGGYFHAGVP